MESRDLLAAGDFLILEEADFFSQTDVGGENTAGDTFGTYLTVGDFNDDGFDDVAAGAPHKADGPANSGIVAAFFGSESGASNGALLRQSDIGEVSEEGDLFGSSLVAGDFNRDGIEDLAIGAPGEAIGSGPRGGAVHVFTTLNTGFVLSQADAGEVDQEGDMFGASVATGDLNGDFFQELIVGAPGKGGSGAIFVFFGSASGLVFPGQMLTQVDAGEIDEPGDLFGAEVTTGAYNGDGFGEIVVGAPGEAPGNDPRSGAVFIFPGSLTGVGPGFMITQADAGEVNEEGDRFGESLGSGDVDSDFDAIEELAIGAPGKAPGGGPRSGALFIFPGAVDVGPTTGFMVTQADAGVVGEDGDEFGAAINFGVLDIDRFEETVIGAPGKTLNGAPNSGAVFIFPGDSSGIQPGFMITQEDGGGVSQAGDRFGSYFAIEDFNDNNGAETVIGAPGDSPDSGPNSGSIFIFPGFPLTPPMVTQKRAGGVNEAGDEFGAAQVAGDFNGDGFEDLAVGAPGEGGAGAVSIFPGDDVGNSGISFGFSITQADAGGTPQWFDRFGATLTSGDLNGDGFADLVYRQSLTDRC